MSKHRLSFASIELLSPAMAEVIVDDGIDISLDMVDEYHDFLLSHLAFPFCLIINKKNRYSYEAKAQLKIADLPQILAMAVIAYKSTTEVVTNLLIQMPRETDWNIKIFHDRDKAIEWLDQQQKQHLQKVQQHNEELLNLDS